MVSLLTCETNSLTGESTLSLMSDKELFEMSFEEYDQFLKEHEVVKTGANADMVKRVGEKIQAAAERWYAKEGKSDALKDYKWEYHLVKDEQVNAWCMPGGKIVVYTGILPLFQNDDKTMNEDMLATVMGHEVSHALLDHGKQRMSASVLQQLGGAFLSLLFPENFQDLFMLAYGLGTNIGIMLPFSRDHENQADEYGLYLMAIAGYDPDESVEFWKRMAKLSGGSIEFLSTHPSHENRINHLNGLKDAARDKAERINHLIQLIPEAKKIAAEINSQ
jgi:predicted Zn-dependent protease